MLPLERQPDVRRFGTFEVDLRARELRKGGIRIRLQDQPFEILTMLLDRPGEAVTRNELRQRLWPAGTFVDFEHSLNAAVKRLRAALGDDADNPLFVETLHRRGYRFIAEVEGPGVITAPKHAGLRVVPKISGEPAVARLVVLPFANLSNDPAQEYFSDGLTEEMITQIGRLCAGRLGVIARTSSMLFKRSGKSAVEIGRELGVDYLLEGSVRHEGDRVRITAQLIHAGTEVHLWAETYDRRLEESLLLQSDVAARIAQSLAMELVPDQRDALAHVSPRQNEAYQAYLKGRFHWNRTGADGLGVASALSYFERTLDLDPDFAAAHASLARANVAIAKHARELPRPALESARSSALRSLQLDPGMSDGHVALAEVRQALEWDWTAAEESYRRAIALAPSCESAHRSYAVLLAGLLRPAEAKAEAERACHIDPLCLSVNTISAWVQYAAGECEAAIDRLRVTLEWDPGFMAARRLLGAAYVAVGRGRDGVAELEKAVAGAPANAVSLAWLAHAQGVTGQRDDALHSIATLDRWSSERYVPSYHLALAYAGAGRIDGAFASLSRACDQREPALINLLVEPRLSPLRGDARFDGLLSKIGLVR